jgi:hypothetical protein
MTLWVRLGAPPGASERSSPERTKRPPGAPARKYAAPCFADSLAAFGALARPLCADTAILHAVNGVRQSLT